MTTRVELNFPCTIDTMLVHLVVAVISHTMYFLAFRNAGSFLSACTDVSVFTMGVTILEACVTICYQVYKVFFAGPRSLDGISCFVFCKFSLISLLFVSIHYTSTCRLMLPVSEQQQLI